MKRYTKILSVWLAVLIYIVNATAQDTESKLTLEQAISLACDSSLTAFKNKNMYLSSYWEFRSYKAQRLPSLVLELSPATYRRFMTQRYDWENNIDVFRPQKTYEAYAALNLSQNFDPLGGKFYMQTSLDYLRNFGNTHTTQYSSVPVRIGYSQSTVGFNSLKWDRKIEPLKFKKAQKELLYNMELLAEETVSAFFDLALAQAKYELAIKNRANSDTLYAVGERRFKLAAISQSDLLTLKLDKINAINDLENCRIALQKARQSLNLLIGQSQNSDITVIIPEDGPEFEIPVDIAMASAKENHPEIIGYQQKIIEAEKNVSKAKVESVMNASLDVSMGFNQSSNNLANAYNSPLRSDLVSLSLTIPLLDWGMRRGKLNMAKNNLRVVEISADQQIQSIEESVMMTIRNFSIQRDLVSSAKEAREIANIAFEQTSQRYILGKADINSLTLAQNRQQTANTNYIVALQNYWASFYRLRRLTLYDFTKQCSLTSLFDQKYGL